MRTGYPQMDMPSRSFKGKKALMAIGILMLCLYVGVGLLLVVTRALEPAGITLIVTSVIACPLSLWRIWAE